MKYFSNSFEIFIYFISIKCIFAWYECNSTTNQITVHWFDTMIFYDYVEFNYKVRETKYEKKFNISNETDLYIIDGLIGGSYVDINLNFISNNSIVDFYEINTITSVEPVTNITAIFEYTFFIYFEFEPIKGYYDEINVKCVENEEQLGSVLGSKIFQSENTNKISCYNLNSGTNYTAYFETVRNWQTKVNQFYDLKTNLDTSNFYVEENDGTKLNINLIIPSGSFEFVELSYRLISTEAYQYYKNNFTRSFCNITEDLKVFSVINYSDMGEQNMISLNLTDLCPMSYYNITATTLKNGYNNKEVYNIIKTGYENVRCENVEILTVYNQTKITWEKSNMKADKYVVSLYNASTDILIVNETIVPGEQNYLDVYNLINECNYDFEITTKYKTFSSSPCKSTITTGPPCPVYNEEYPIKLKTAPYVDYVFINISKDIFTSAELIKRVLIIVGNQNKCSDLETNNFCYVAFNMTINEFLANDEIYRLSTDKECANNQTCNIRFIIDTDFYIHLKAIGYCGIASSAILKINIPSPFPLGIYITITSACSISIVSIFLVVIFIIAYKHVKERHAEEQNMLINESKSDNSNSEVTSFGID